MKAPMVDRTVDRLPCQVGGAGRLARAPEADRDLANHRNPIAHPIRAFPTTLQVLRVQPPAATEASVLDESAIAPAGV